MKEEQRKAIVDEINRRLADKKTLEFRKQELERLSKDNTVQTFLALQKSIKDTEEEIESHRDVYGNLNDSVEKRINKAFRHGIKKENCNHGLWLYEGAYYEREDSFGDTHYFLKLNYYNSYYKNPKFAFNRYTCIECGKLIEAKDGESFESIHHVLKDKDQIFRLDYYQDMYYQLLYLGWTSEEAFEEIQKEFLRNKNESNKTKKLKQGK